MITFSCMCKNTADDLYYEIIQKVDSLLDKNEYDSAHDGTDESYILFDDQNMFPFPQ